MLLTDTRTGITKTRDIAPLTITYFSGHFFCSAAKDMFCGTTTMSRLHRFYESILK